MPSREEIEAVAADHGFDLTTVEGRVRAERVAQGLPPQIEDKAVLAAIERLSRPSAKAAS